MARKPRANKIDPFEREIELAFKPGTFIPDGMCFSFVCDLRQVAAKIDAMVSGPVGTRVRESQVSSSRDTGVLHAHVGRTSRLRVCGLAVAQVSEVVWASAQERAQ